MGLPFFSKPYKALLRTPCDVVAYVLGLLIRLGLYLPSDASGFAGGFVFVGVMFVIFFSVGFILANLTEIDYASFGWEGLGLLRWVRFFLYQSSGLG